MYLRTAAKKLTFLVLENNHYKHGVRITSSIDVSSIIKRNCLNCKYHQLRFIQCSNRTITTNKDDNLRPTQLSATARFKEAVIKVLPRKKEKNAELLSYQSTERNFITTVRAMNEFLLSSSDLEGLRKTKRRSPFEDEPPITVYWRKDIEYKALQLYGTWAAIEKERLRREVEVKQYEEKIFNIKKLLKAYKQRNRKKYLPVDEDDRAGTVVWTAVAINGLNLVMKLGAWAYTGSHCLFAESLHSLADVTNQLILAYGIHKSKQGPDLIHPYGYTTMRYVSSLISGAMIFCIGAGVTFQHGVHALMTPTEIVPFFWAYLILGISFVSEGGTLLMAIHAIKKGAKKEGCSFKEYVLRGEDPSVNVVLLEDAAAVLGVGVALSCMGLTSITGSHVPDALGSCFIGVILAGVSGFIVYTNSLALVGRSIPQEHLIRMNKEIEDDIMIRAIHDVKGIDMGAGFVRYKAEVDFDGRELTRNYLDKQDLQFLLEEVQKMQTIEELEKFILRHGENIVDTLGAEIDRIECALKLKHPDIRHCDLEIL